MCRGVHQDQPAHGHGVMRHVAVVALCIAHPQRHGPVRGIELWQIGVVLSKEAVEERDLRLHASVSVDPHPVSIKLGFYWLGGNNGAVGAALGELTNYDLRSLRIYPKQDGVCGLVDTPFRLIVPERVWELPRRQAVAETCP